MDQLTVPLYVALMAATVAAVTDVRRFRIYNMLTIPLLLVGLLYHAFMGAESFVMSGLGVLMGCMLLLPLYLAGGMGAGDVKLMAGLGAWLGPVVILKVLLVSCLINGVYSTVLWVHRRTQHPSQRPTACRVEEAAASDSRRLRVVPFGVAVAVAVVFTFAGLFFPFS